MRFCVCFCLPAWRVCRLDACVWTGVHIHQALCAAGGTMIIIFFIASFQHFQSDRPGGSIVFNTCPSYRIFLTLLICFISHSRNFLILFFLDVIMTVFEELKHYDNSASSSVFSVPHQRADDGQPAVSLRLWEECRRLGLHVFLCWKWLPSSPAILRNQVSYRTRLPLCWKLVCP